MRRPARSLGLHRHRRQPDRRASRSQASHPEHRLRPRELLGVGEPDRAATGASPSFAPAAAARRAVGSVNRDADEHDRLTRVDDRARTFLEQRGGSPPRRRSSALIALLLTWCSSRSRATASSRRQNLSLVLQQVIVVGVLAIGQTLVILTAGIDLSVGTVMAFGQIVMTKLAVENGVHPLLAIALGILACVALRTAERRPSSPACGCPRSSSRWARSTSPSR